MSLKETSPFPPTRPSTLSSSPLLSSPVFLPCYLPPIPQAIILPCCSSDSFGDWREKTRQRYALNYHKLPHICNHRIYLLSFILRSGTKLSIWATTGGMIITTALTETVVVIMMIMVTNRDKHLPPHLLSSSRIDLHNLWTENVLQIVKGKFVIWWILY